MNKIPNFDKLIEPYVEIYRDIETRLILKIADSFKLYQDIDLKNSMQWYLTKIKELGGLNNEAIDIIHQRSKIPKKDIIKVLKKAGYSPLDIDTINKANKTGKYNINVDKLLASNRVNEIIDHSYKDINNNIFKMINTNAQEAFNNAYMNVLNEAYTSISSGAFDYNTSIRNALTDLNKSGINVISYKQKDGSVRNYSIETSVRRDMLTAIVQTTNKVQDELVKEMGAEYVEVSQHLGARIRTKYTKYDYEAHDEWQGKVYKLEGSDSKYPNFYEKTGYGEITGLGGVNCRHIKWAFFPGISTPKKYKVDKKESAKLYELSQEQRKYEDKIRKYKRQIEIGKKSKDIEQVNKYNIKLDNTLNEYSDFCKDNNLKRNYERERIFNIATKEEKKLYRSEINSYVVGKININEYTDIFDLTTKDVVLLPERRKHILERHPEMSEHLDKIPDILAKPDKVFKQLDKDDTIWLIKNIDDNNLRLILKINTKLNVKEKGYKNSIIQYQIMRKNMIPNSIKSKKIEELTKK